MLVNLFSSLKARLGQSPDTSWQIYRSVAALARNPSFYEAPYAVPDTLDGRFDWLGCLVGTTCLHINTMPEPEASAVSQAIFDHFFKQVELNLREAGIGDLAVPKQMRRMIQAFYGRMALLTEIIQTSSQAEQDLAVLLERNLYAQSTDKKQATALAQWLVTRWTPFLKNYKNMSEINKLINDVQLLSQDNMKKVHP
jgi:cytochrome b pre-mRNA-processing protein 3